MLLCMRQAIQSTCIMKTDYSVLLIQLDGNLASHQVESRELNNLSSSTELN